MEAWGFPACRRPLGATRWVPQVHWDFTSERTDRWSGSRARIDDVAAIRKKGFDGTDLVKALLFSVLRVGLRTRAVPWGSACRQPAGRRSGLDRVPRLRHHGPHRPADALAAARTRTRCWSRRTTRAGKIVVLMGAVGKVKPEAEAAKGLGRSPSR